MDSHINFSWVLGLASSERLASLAPRHLSLIVWVPSTCLLFANSPFRLRTSAKLSKARHMSARLYLDKAGTTRPSLAW